MSLQQFYFPPSNSPNKNSVILNDIKSDRGETMYDIPYMWNLKSDTNELTKQKETHKLGEQAYDCQ